jgi:hypothetical protein
MRGYLALTTGLLLVAISAIPNTPALAQTLSPAEQVLEDTDRLFLLWARNIARGAAEQANGGLEFYRAEPAMHGPPLEAPFVVNDDGTLTFTFLGYDPLDLGLDGTPIYSVETEVLVFPNRTFEVIYNGPIR